MLFLTDLLYRPSSNVSTQCAALCGLQLKYLYNHLNRQLNNTDFLCCIRW